MLSCSPAALLSSAAAAAEFIPPEITWFVVWLGARCVEIFEDYSLRLIGVLPSSDGFVKDLSLCKVGPTDTFMKD